MPNARSVTPAKVAPELYDHIRGLLRAGKNDQAIARACAIHVLLPNDLVAKELLFDAFFQKRDYLPALAVAEELVRLQPGSARLESFLVATLVNMKSYEDARKRALQYVERYGDDNKMLDALKVTNFFLGRTAEAVSYGQRTIDLLDIEARRNTPPASLILPTAPPAGKNVISFSLWGSKLIYCYGAMINIILSRTTYPGWTCRFYVDQNVPRKCVAYLAENGAEIFNIEDEYPRLGLFQRFLVMNDRSVGRFIIRDCDARLSEAEAKLVQEWIASDLPFHVIRDHVLHTALIMGGLWGGRTDTGIDIAGLMRGSAQNEPTALYGHDQRVLGLTLWPLIREQCLVHTRHYHLADVHEIPLPERREHFGAGYQNINTVRAEAERLAIPRDL